MSRFDREQKRLHRHSRIRKKVNGTTACPRICVHRSLKNFSVQLVDDSLGKVLMGMTTLNKEVRGAVKNGGNIAAAAHLGTVFAAQAQKKGIKSVCFDRGGYIYHGRVKAFAEAAREAGMEF